jgi:hypothetical protein
MIGIGLNKSKYSANAMRTSVNNSNNDILFLFTIESIMMSTHGNGMSFMAHLTPLHLTIYTQKQL